MPTGANSTNLDIRLNLSNGFLETLYTPNEIAQLFFNNESGRQPNAPSPDKFKHMVNRGDYYLFRPVSDTPDSVLEQQLRTPNRNYLGQYPHALLSLDKPVVFPLMERGPLFGKPREHFVALHYDPLTSKATLIESVASGVSRLYSLDPLYMALQCAGLQIVGNIEIVYQNIQYEDGICGHIAAQNCRALLEGHAPADLENYLTKHDLPRIHAYNSTLAHATPEQRAEIRAYAPQTVNFFQRHWGKFTAVNVVLGMVVILLLSAVIIYATGGLAAIPLIGGAVAAKLGVGLAGSFAAGGVFGAIAGVVTTMTMGIGEFISRKLHSTPPPQASQSSQRKEQADDSNDSFVDVTEMLQSASKPSMMGDNNNPDGRPLNKRASEATTEPAAFSNSSFGMWAQQRDSTPQRPPHVPLLKIPTRKGGGDSSSSFSPNT